jgi:streptogramin lyase
VLNRLTVMAAACGILLLSTATCRTAGANASATRPRVKTFRLPPGGDPWGLAIDRAGDIWFAEPACDVSPACSPRLRPGRIGELNPAPGA